MKEILINCGYTQKSGVILNGGELENVFIEHDGSGGVGNIYKGTVDNVVPGMQSAFVDIGLDKNAFLFAGDISAPEEARAPKEDIRRLVHKGQDVIVQVTKEAQGAKGARVTTAVTVPGRKLVLMPMLDYIGISKKIEDEEEKARLSRIMSCLKVEGHGYIVRTDAQGTGEEELKAEMAYLEEQWSEICKTAKSKNAPALLYSEDSLLLTVLRDYCDNTVDRIVLNDKTVFEEALKIALVMAPALKEKIFFRQGNLFADAGIETKLKKLLQRRVWLDNGAYLMIDYTEALTVIDVNTGKFTGDYDLHKTILRTNLSAAKEIARQLRLRAIGGIIVIDFIDMETDEERTAVLKALEEAAAGDKIKTNILGFAPLGLVEVTRKKTRLSLADSMQRLCPYCEGDGRILNEKTIVNSLLFELERCVKNHETACAVLRLNPYISAALKQQNDILREHFSDISIFVREDMSMHVEDYNITPIRKGEEMADREGLVRVL